MTLQLGEVAPNEEHCAFRFLPAMSEIFRAQAASATFGAYKGGVPCRNTKFTDGLNDRPKDAPIGQAGEGLLDNTSRPVDVDDSTIHAVRKKLNNGRRGDLLKEVKQKEDASRIGFE